MARDTVISIWTINIDTNNVFNMVQQLTLYMSKNIRSKDGSNTYTDVALTRNERDFFDTEVRSVCDELYDVMSGYTKDVSTTLIPNTTNYYTPLAYNIVDNRITLVTYNIGQYSSDVDPTLYDILGRNLVDAIKYGMVVKWCEANGLDKQIATYSHRYEESKTKVISNLSKRKRLVTVPYKFYP